MRSENINNNNKTLSSRERKNEIKKMRNKMVKCRRIQTTLTEKARNNNSNELTNEGLYVEKVKCIKTFKQYVPIAYVLQIASTLFFGFSVSFSVYLLFLLLLRFAFGYLYMR